MSFKGSLKFMTRSPGIRSPVTTSSYSRLPGRSGRQRSLGLCCAMVQTFQSGQSLHTTGLLPPAFAPRYFARSSCFTHLQDLRARTSRYPPRLRLPLPFREVDFQRVIFAHWIYGKSGANHPIRGDVGRLPTFWVLEVYALRCTRHMLMLSRWIPVYSSTCNQAGDYLNPSGCTDILCLEGSSGEPGTPGLLGTLVCI